MAGRIVELRHEGRKEKNGEGVARKRNGKKGQKKE